MARALATMGLLFGLLLQIDNETSSQLVTSTNTLIAVARLSPTPNVIGELAKTKRHLAREIAQLDVELARGVADGIAPVEILEWRRVTYARQIVEIDALTT